MKIASRSTLLCIVLAFYGTLCISVAAHADSDRVYTSWVWNKRVSHTLLEWRALEQQWCAEKDEIDARVGQEQAAGWGTAAQWVIHGAQFGRDIQQQAVLGSICAGERFGRELAEQAERAARQRKAAYGASSQVANGGHWEPPADQAFQNSQQEPLPDPGTANKQRRVTGVPAATAERASPVDHTIAVGVLGLIGVWLLAHFAILAILILLYMLPTIIAVSSHKEGRWAIAILNLLLGWSGIGWFAMLIWAFCAQRQQLMPARPA